jgi:hypothetical protein
VGVVDLERLFWRRRKKHLMRRKRSVDQVQRIALLPIKRRKNRRRKQQPSLELQPTNPSLLCPLRFVSSAAVLARI